MSRAARRPPSRPGRAVLQEALGNLPHLDSAAGTDYTVYTKTDLTLREGEKAILTLFTKKISYSHVYRWSPPAPMEHSLVLHNATDTAWTTGPCLAHQCGASAGRGPSPLRAPRRQRRAAGDHGDQHRRGEDRAGDRPQDEGLFPPQRRESSTW